MRIGHISRQTLTKSGFQWAGAGPPRWFFPELPPPEPRDQTDLSSERAEKAAQCTEPKTGGSVRFCGVFGGVHVDEESLQNV